MGGRMAAPQIGAPGLPGPTQQQLAAAGSIPPGEQRKMAEGMVARLEQRLRDDPSNLDGWVMLMRSRMTLGEPEQAKAALDAAVRANPGAAARLRAERSDERRVGKEGVSTCSSRGAPDTKK